MGQPIRLSGLKAKYVMTPNVIVVNEDDSVAFAIKMFDRCHISGAPVVNRQGDYVGVISKTDLFSRDVIEFLTLGCNLEDMEVRQIMCEMAPITVDEDVCVERAAEVMLRHHIHRVFVTSGDEIVGVLSSYDVLKVVSSVELPSVPVMAVVENDKEQCLITMREQLRKDIRKEQQRRKQKQEHQPQVKPA